jgi:hypothetical protein
VGKQDGVFAASPPPVPAATLRAVARRRARQLMRGHLYGPEAEEAARRSWRATGGRNADRGPGSSAGQGAAAGGVPGAPAQGGQAGAFGGDVEGGMRARGDGGPRVGLGGDPASEAAVDGSVARALAYHGRGATGAAAGEEAQLASDPRAAAREVGAAAGAGWGLFPAGPYGGPALDESAAVVDGQGLVGAGE